MSWAFSSISGSPLYLYLSESQVHRNDHFFIFAYLEMAVAEYFAKQTPLSAAALEW